MNYGFGCAVVVDGKDRIYVTSRSPNACVVIFDSRRQDPGNVDQGHQGQGRVRPEPVRGDRPRPVLEQGRRSASTCTGPRTWPAPKGQPKLGARVYKTDLNGQDPVPARQRRQGDARRPRSSTSPTRPTWPSPPTATSTSSTATAASSSTGSTRTSSSSRRSAGRARSTASSTPATASGSARSRRSRRSTSPTGTTTASRSTRSDLEYKRTIRGVRNPCCFYQHDGHLYIPELGARVTILDADDKVVAHLGDGLALRNKKEDRGQAPGGVRHPARPDAWTRRATCTWSSGCRTAGPRKLAPATRELHRELRRVSGARSRSSGRLRDPLDRQSHRPHSCPDCSSALLLSATQLSPPTATGPCGAARTATARPTRPASPPAGRPPRTSSGRRRSPATATRRRSSGATGCSSRRPSRTATRRGRRIGCSSASTARTARSSGRRRSLKAPLEPSTSSTAGPARRRRPTASGCTSPSSTTRRCVVAAYDFSGNEVWRVSPGEFQSNHGFCTPPILYKDLVIVNCDQDAFKKTKPAYIVALDRKTGRGAVADRPDAPHPLVLPAADRRGRPARRRWS